MNPSDKKNLYTPLAEVMVDEMDHRNNQPPAYQPSQQTTPMANVNQSQGQQYQASSGGGVAPNVNPINVVPATPLGDVMMINNPQVGPKAMVITCPHCRARSKTSIRYSSTAKTHIACLLLSWTMCCCCLPYCMKSCQNANHYCSMCDTFIGTYSS